MEIVYTNDYLDNIHKCLDQTAKNNSLDSVALLKTWHGDSLLKQDHKKALFDKSYCKVWKIFKFQKWM